MRVTTSILLRDGLASVGVTRETLARIQEQAATGLKINRPSDDPVGTRSAAFLKKAITFNDRFQRNIDIGRTRIQATEQALADSREVVIRAKTLAVQGANQPIGDKRALLADEVEQLFERLLKNANSTVPGGGSYLFSGNAASTQPFVPSGGFGSGPPGPTVSFAGDNTEKQVEIDEGVKLQVSLDGERVFQGGTDIFQALVDLHDRLLVPPPSNGSPDPVAASIDDMTAALAQLNRETTRNGGADEQADVFESRLALQKQDLQGQLSLVQDADTYEVFSSLSQQQTALQAALQITSQIIQPSLLDFL